MGVNIIPSETEITIEVTVRDKTINDAIQLSSGETAIISLLINACILHIVGYPIICLDECDAFADNENSVKYISLLEAIRSVLSISQIILISHHIDVLNLNGMSELHISVTPNGERMIDIK